MHGIQRVNMVLGGILAAQQEAERSKFVVAKAEQERRAAIIRAEGESEAAKLVLNLFSFVSSLLFNVWTQVLRCDALLPPPSPQKTNFSLTVFELTGPLFHLVPCQIISPWGHRHFCPCPLGTLVLWHGTRDLLYDFMLNSNVVRFWGLFQCLSFLRFIAMSFVSELYSNVFSFWASFQCL